MAVERRLAALESKVFDDFNSTIKQLQEQMATLELNANSYPPANVSKSLINIAIGEHKSEGGVLRGPVAR
jgi:hypothetical protein